jgi:hypothetical protein
MVRGTSIALGIGLAILWIVGLSNHAAIWLTWLDALAALGAFAVAAAAVPDTPRSTAVAASPILLATGLFVVWIIGLAVHAESYMAWWTFAFACAFLLLGLFSGTTTTTSTRHPQAPLRA